MEEEHRLQLILAQGALGRLAINPVLAILNIYCRDVVSAGLTLFSESYSDVVTVNHVAGPCVVDIWETVRIVAGSLVEPLDFKSGPWTSISVTVGSADILHFLEPAEAVEGLLKHPEPRLAVEAGLSFIEQVSEYSGIYLKPDSAECLVNIKPLQCKLGEPVR